MLHMVIWQDFIEFFYKNSLWNMSQTGEQGKASYVFLLNIVHKLILT